MPQHQHERGSVGLVFGVLIRASQRCIKNSMTPLELAQLKGTQRHRLSTDNGTALRLGPEGGLTFIDLTHKKGLDLHTLRTDQGHEFQAQFRWHVEDKGIRHEYIKPRSPELNGKVERFHRSDQEEFYQLLRYKDDVDLSRKREEWERFYNFDRPHSAFGERTPYAVLRSLWG